MAVVDITSTKRYTNVVEYIGDTMDTLNDEMRVHVNSSDLSFAIDSVGSANFAVILEGSFDEGSNWFTINAAQTISAAGEYVYHVTGKVMTLVRVRLSAITSGTPDVTPHIAVAYHG
tara:strand:- start:41 stop:391 length:351 start_codon:yes stop_codon:yes gene_type:complete